MEWTLFDYNDPPTWPPQNTLVVTAHDDPEEEVTDYVVQVFLNLAGSDNEAHEWWSERKAPTAWLPFTRFQR